PGRRRRRGRLRPSPAARLRAPRADHHPLPRTLLAVSNSRGWFGGATPVVLVLRALGLGDFLTILPALRGLSEAFPGHRRILAAPARLEPLARHSGAVDEGLATDPLGPVAC